MAAARIITGFAAIFCFHKCQTWDYNRLGYEIKRDLTNFCVKISQGLKRPQQKFIHQMLYGILAGNKLHLSEISRSREFDTSF
jgi:hypothetical protein